MLSSLVGGMSRSLLAMRAVDVGYHVIVSKVTLSETALQVQSVRKKRMWASLMTRRGSLKDQSRSIRQQCALLGGMRQRRGGHAVITDPTLIQVIVPRKGLTYREMLGEPGGLRRRLAGGAAWSLSGAVISRTLGLVATLLTAALLVPRQFGQLSLLQLVITLLTGVAGLGLRIATTKRIADARSVDPVGAGRYIGFVTLLSSSAGTGVAIACLLGGHWVARHVLLDPGLFVAVVGAAGVIEFTTVSSVQLGVLTGLEAFREIAILQGLESFLTGFLTVVGILVGGLQGAMIGWMVGEALTAAASVAATRYVSRRADVPVSYRVQKPELLILWRLGLPALIGSLFVSAAVLGSQRLLAAGAHGLSAVAAFNVAYRWQLVALFVPSAMAPIFLPILTQLNAVGRIREFRRVLRINLLTNIGFTIPACLAIMAIGPFVMSLTGHFYGTQTTVLAVLLVATLPTVVNNVLSQTALSVGAVAAWVWSDVALAVSLAVVTMVLVPRDGAIGLGLAYVVGYVVTCLALVRPVRSRLAAMRPEAV